MNNHSDEFDEHVKIEHGRLHDHIPEKARQVELPGDIHTHTVDAVQKQLRGYFLTDAIAQPEFIAKWRHPTRRTHVT